MKIEKFENQLKESLSDDEKTWASSSTKEFSKDFTETIDIKELGALDTNPKVNEVSRPKVKNFKGLGTIFFFIFGLIFLLLSVLKYLNLP